MIQIHTKPRITNWIRVQLRAAFNLLRFLWSKIPISVFLSMKEEIEDEIMYDVCDILQFYSQIEVFFGMYTQGTYLHQLYNFKYTFRFCKTANTTKDEKKINVFLACDYIYVIFTNLLYLTVCHGRTSQFSYSVIRPQNCVSFRKLFF